MKGGARVFDAAAAASHVVFDKTGTLTTGRLQLKSAHSLPSELELHREKIRQCKATGYLEVLEHGGSELFHTTQLSRKDLTRVVAAAAALESGAVHPIADAVRQKASELGGDLPVVTDCKVIGGQGVEGVLSFEEGDGLGILQGKLGRPSFILEVGVRRFDRSV